MRLEWGHPLLTPEGKEIRLPKLAFPLLRRLGLLQRNRNLGLQQISPMIYELMHSDYEKLMGVILRRLLGSDVSGPEAVACPCRECKDQRAEMLRDLRPDWKQLIDQTQPGLYEY